MAGDHSRVASADASTARQFRHCARGASGTLRLYAAECTSVIGSPTTDYELLITDNGYPVYSSTSPGHRRLQCKNRHLALPGLGSDALRRIIFLLHSVARWRTGRVLAAWLAQYTGRHGKYHRTDYFEHNDGHGLGFVQDESIRQIQVLSCLHDSAGLLLRRHQVI